jgi:glycosyltransferase involved in cell wall biosynthesis
MNVIRSFQENHPKGQDIHIIKHEQNQGVSASRNEIIKKAQGTFLYFMDSDDLIAENTISLLIQNIRQYDAEIVFGSYEKIEISGGKEIYRYPSLMLLNQDQLAIFAYRQYAGIQASACNYLVKASLLRENHFHFIDADYWEDLVFTFDLVTLISRAVLLSEITYTYRCHEGSLSHYQNRHKISKEEVMKNVRTIEHLKLTSHRLSNKVYYPNRCYNIMMTDFFIVCHILKRRKDIVPSISNKEVKSIMWHPATLSQICSFRQSRFGNLFFFVLSKLPSWLCVFLINLLAKIKKMI